MFHWDGWFDLNKFDPILVFILFYKQLVHEYANIMTSVAKQQWDDWEVAKCIMEMLLDQQLDIGFSLQG